MGDLITLGNRLRRIRNSKFRAWTAYSVILPALAVCACWPVAEYLFGVHYAFEKTFISGDLLLLGALLSIGIAVEIYAEQKSVKEFDVVDPEEVLDKLYHRSQVFAFVLGGLFWCVKMKSINFEFPFIPTSSGASTLPAALPSEIQLVVWLSIIWGLAAMFWAYTACNKVYLIFLSAEIRELIAAKSGKEDAVQGGPKQGVA